MDRQELSSLPEQRALVGKFARSRGAAPPPRIPQRGYIDQSMPDEAVR